MKIYILGRYIGTHVTYLSSHKCHHWWCSHTTGVEQQRSGLLSYANVLTYRLSHVWLTLFQPLA